jgi:hypothetical protein
MPNSQDYQIIRMPPGVNFAPLSNFGKAHLPIPQGKIK